MPHPYPKPILPKYPSTPFLPQPTDHAGYFTGPSGTDGQGKLWGFDEFVLEANDYIANQVGASTHDGRSAQFFLDNINATTGGNWQVQDAPLTTDQQKASVSAGCTTARLYGAGTSSWFTALHDPMNGSPWTPILGGAFSNDNYKNGVVTYNGVTADEVLQIFRNALTAYIRAGGIST